MRVIVREKVQVAKFLIGLFAICAEFGHLTHPCLRPHKRLRKPVLARLISSSGSELAVSQARAIWFVEPCFRREPHSLALVSVER